MSATREEVKVPQQLGGSKHDRGGHWAAALPHFYGDDEPDVPVHSAHPTDTGVGLERRLVLSRQAYFRQQKKRGEAKLAGRIPALLHATQDESGFIVMPNNHRLPRAPPPRTTDTGEVYNPQL